MWSDHCLLYNYIHHWRLNEFQSHLTQTVLQSSRWYFVFLQLRRIDRVYSSFQQLLVGLHLKLNSVPITEIMAQCNKQTFVLNFVSIIHPDNISREISLRKAQNFNFPSRISRIHINSHQVQVNVRWYSWNVKVLVIDRYTTKNQYIRSQVGAVPFHTPVVSIWSSCTHVLSSFPSKKQWQSQWCVAMVPSSYLALLSSMYKMLPLAIASRSLHSIAE